MISLKQFLLETQQRIDGIKKVHLPKITGMFNGKTTHDIMMNGVKNNRFSELRDIADKTGKSCKYLTITMKFCDLGDSMVMTLMKIMCLNIYSQSV